MPPAKISLYKRYACWKQLEKHSKKLQATDLKTLFSKDKKRAEFFSTEVAGLHLDFSKNFINQDTLKLFTTLAREAKLAEALNALVAGKNVNDTENRPAWHTALRDRNPPKEVSNTLAHMTRLVDEVHSGTWRGFSGKKITDVVNIGIGGSDLGPRMAVFALSSYHTGKVRSHFVSNIDPSDIIETLKQLNPETTLFIIASKSFTTLETLANAEKAKHWFLKVAASKDIARHFIAVSTAIDKAKRFGIDPKNIFPLWDWVGGRYSLWSAIGLPVAFAIGMKNFHELLHGAHAMDKHLLEADIRQNMPIMLAMLDIWYSQFFNAQTHVVLPYSHYLKLFPDFLQQLEMESSGKHVDKSGRPVDYPTGSIIWGAAGTNGQHSFHQLLHQGKHFISADFILPLTTTHDDEHLGEHQHRHLIANCLSQRQAMLQGKTLKEAKQELREMGLSESEVKRLAPHKVIPGNRPNNIISFEALTPHTLGALIALYEHKVYIQSVIWHTNAFDQWGVELGKQLSTPIFDALSEKNILSSIKHMDTSTQSLIRRYQQLSKNSK